jgi:2-oxoglutarate dehydrogenase E2 component (dihydrolipoamide succinyltransferase)
MKIAVKVPSVGESIAKVRVSMILKPNGAYVEEAEELLELETDKVNQVVYAPASGILQWDVRLEEEVSIEYALGWIDTEGKSTEQGKPSIAEQEKPVEPLEKRAAPPIEPQKNRGTSTEEGSATTKKGIRKRLSSLRRTIGQRLVEAKNQTAMLTTFNEVDMGKVIELREREKEAFLERYRVKLGFMSFFVKSSVSALKEFPQVGAFIEKDELIFPEEIDISLAVSTEQGLVVPVLRKCEALSFGEIEQQLQEVAKKAREGSLKIQDLQGGIFTITNGGTFGSMLSTPILNPPQSAILGMHAIIPRPVVVDGEIVIRPIMYLALSYDHRVIDGKEAVQFLVHIKKIIENPERLLLDL